MLRPSYIQDARLLKVKGEGAKDLKLLAHFFEICYHICVHSPFILCAWICSSHVVLRFVLWPCWPPPLSHHARAFITKHISFKLLPSNSISSLTLRLPFQHHAAFCLSAFPHTFFLFCWEHKIINFILRLFNSVKKFPVIFLLQYQKHNIERMYSERNPEFLISLIDWPLYVPPGLTFNNCTFCPHCVFMCFVWI